MNNQNIQFSMTDQIAYRLGKFDFPCFYQYALWKVNKEPFPLAYFFEWTVPGVLGGWPLKYKGEESVTDWENISASGKLKLELIKDISHKLAYIRGRLSSYSVVITDTEINVYYANSHNFRDFLAECLYDVLMDKFILLPKKEGGFGRECYKNAPEFKIEKHERFLTTPATPSVKLTSTKEVIDYLVGKDIKYED